MPGAVALKFLSLMLKLLQLHLRGAKLSFDIFTLTGSGRMAGGHFKLGAADLEVVSMLGSGWHCRWTGMRDSNHLFIAYGFLRREK